ncbi:cytochrome P450 [Alkalihalobacterium chitinilyticum]|uniref:Cytochrome P450 n=1 Tax=Alkalihalobacterium chitinilyticum TaxID=2980103 RepID=A0ABT5VDK6_9BACI|nr:cytochrome P450 [Alkalihalobacterium chitinilyticum]MDE5413236.1 cytochrome P450 [Alkalihalobacterium chitinilyticum]
MGKIKDWHQIKGPRGSWLSGNLKEFQKDPLLFLTQLSNVYGDVAKFRFGPFQKVYHVSNPDLIKEILVSKQKNFIKSKDLNVLKDVVGEGLLTSEKEMHLKQRRLIQPAFKKTHITQYAQDMIDVTANYISDWEDGREYLMSKEMMNVTLGIITKTMFSMDFKEGSEAIGQPIETYMKLAVKRMRAIVRLPLWLPTKNNKSYKKSIHILEQTLTNIIEDRRKSDERNEDLLGMLMKARSEVDGLRMSNQQLMDELMTIFLAGHETTANALTWTLFLISQHPIVMKKLNEEINEVIGDRNIQPDDFSKLTYTQNVFWESLRLFPPAYVIGRQVDSDVEIGDYVFKKGEMILISPYVVHRSPLYFEDPTSFIPERFEKDLLKTLPSFAFFPFGGGPRVCIGNHFAVMEAVLVLVSIFQRYHLTLAPDHHDVKPQPLITLRPKQGIRMIVTKK